MSEFLDAVKSGDLVRIGQLLDVDATLLGESENGVSAVLLALYHGKPEAAGLLIERGAPLSFHEACAAGVNDRAMKMLAGDPSLRDQFSKDGYPPLGLAIFFGNRDLARVLIDRGADVNASSNNAQHVAPLHAAAAVCDHEIMRLLLDRGADPNARQQNDFTPLHTAASRGDVEMAKLLLAHGANRDARTAEETGVADIARQRGKSEFAEWWEKQF